MTGPIIAVFTTEREALAYRSDNGGWVFVPADASGFIWFATPAFTPTGIMLHRITAGQSGEIK